MDAWAIARTASALLLLAILPGLVWARVLLPGPASIPERIVSAIVLSVLMITLALWLGDVVLGVRISGASAIGWSLSLTLAGLGVLAAGALQRRLVVASG